MEVLAVAFAVFVPPALLPPALSLAPASSSSITRRGRQHRHGENDEGDRSHSASVADSLHTGTVNVNVEPTPVWLLTQILPPWSSTNFRHKVSPSPVPSCFVALTPT
jgi:hypothetical protein